MTETDVSRLFTFAVGGHMVDGQDGDANGNRKQRSGGRDPTSHRIIEKRRRDRMNNCLADLSQLIPTTFIRQGQGRIEKTEIIEMAIRHIKFLQSHVNPSNKDDHQACKEMYMKGYQECQSDTFGFLEEVGYCVTDSVLINLKNKLDSKVTQLQAEIKSLPQVFQRESGENFTSPPQWSRTSSQTGTGSGGSGEYSLGTDNLLRSDMQEGQGDSGIGGSSKAGQGSSDTSSGGKSSQPTAYKIKQKFEERFINHAPENMGTDAEALPPKVSPSEEDKEDFKDPQTQIKCTENSPSSLCQDNGNGSAYGSGSSVHSFNSSESSKSVSSGGSGQNISLNNTVPAFALHPMGYFYIPVVLPIAQVMPFISAHKSMGVCHPVSIPVSFTGPFPIGSQDKQSQPLDAPMPSFGGHLAATMQGMDYRPKHCSGSSKKSRSSVSYSSRETNKSGESDSKDRKRP